MTEPLAQDALPQPATNWKVIEQDFRCGIKTLRQIAGEHAITEGAIRKRAKAQSWTRDLNARIKLKADDLVRKQAVRNLVRSELVATEHQVIEANAEAITRVRLGHRKDIGRGRDLAVKLLAELEGQTNNLELMEQLGKIMANPDDKSVDKLGEAYRKAISLGGRVATIKALSETLKNLIALERQAFGLDDAEPAPQNELNELSDEELDSRMEAALARSRSE